jgi:protein-S-isoprenylcysteine O-methyltransferase Ste14
LGLLALLSDAPKNEGTPDRLPDRLIDIALGLSVWSWAVLGLVRADESARGSLVRLTITALNVCVGALFLTRGAILRRAPLGALLLCLPSLVMSGVALKLARPEAAWPLHAAVVFAGSGLFATASLLSLGRCFGLLPAVRGVATGGTYRLLRHPAYAGELGMVAACALASPRPLLAWIAAAAAAALIALRIRVEERLLTEVPDYREYAGRVRYRLLPGIW